MRGSSSHRRMWSTVLTLAVLCGSADLHSAVGQTRDGSLTARVTDTSSVNIYAATVRLLGTHWGGTTEASGIVHLEHLPVGSYNVRVAALGYAPDSVAVTVNDGRTTSLTLRLRPAAILLSEVSVRAQRLGETEGAALSRQQDAPNIVTVLPGDEIRALPNYNAAEAAGRIPGVSIERDEGEGKFVQVRGTEPRLSNVTINGSHVPGTETDRIPKLDDVPSDLLGAIEVSKTLTADMDADAIGGSVNLVTKTPEGPPRGYIAGQFGQMSLLSRTNGQGGLTYGGRFGDGGRLGFLIGASIDRNNRAINDVEPAWAVDGAGRSYPVEWSERDYLYGRNRYGVGGDLDYRFDEHSSIYVKGMWSDFENLGIRYVNDVSSGGDSAATGHVGFGTGTGVTRTVSHRTPREQMWSLNAGGRQDLAGLTLDYSFNSTGTRQSETDYRTSSFDYSGGDLTIRYDGSNPEVPTFTHANDAQAAAVLAPANYALSNYKANYNLTTGRDIGGSANALMRYLWGAHPAAFKFGLRLRDENKDNDAGELAFKATGTLTLAQVLGTFSDPHFYSSITNSYLPFGPVPDNGLTSTWEDLNPAAFKDKTDSVGNALASFSGSERIYAAYMMNDVDLGRFHLNLGLRLEHTHSSYVGHVAATPTDSAGDPTGPTTVTTVPGSRDYDDLFPSVQLRYRSDDNTNLRLAVTRAIARPNYTDLAPSLSGSLGSIYQHQYSNLSAGNPNLVPEHSWSLDVLFEHFLPGVGVISAGVFYKNITDVILQRTFVYNGPYVPFQGYYGTQPQNGGSGHLLGVEARWAQHLTFLPGVLGGLGVDVNYTHISSSVVVDTSGRTAPLLRQAPDLANVAVTYDRGAVSARIAWTYNGPNITAYGDGSSTANGDNYFYAHSQIDGSVIFNVTPSVQMQIMALNLNNAVFGFFNGTPSHAYSVQREYYGRTFYLGMKYGF